MSAQEQIERAQLRALVIARIMVAFYGLELLLNLLRPRRLDHEPSLTVLAAVPKGASGDAQRLFHLPQLVFWTVLVALLIGLVLQFVAMRYPAGSRSAIILTRAALGALIGPFALIPLTVLGTWPLITLLCLPTTAAALVLLNGLQQYTRLPWAVLAAAFGWGSLIVWGFVRACTSLAYGTVQAYIGPDLTLDPANLDMNSLISGQFRVLTVLIVHLTVLTPLAAAGGITILLILLRRQVIDVVTGIAIGGAVGLGVVLVESVLFIELWGSLSGFFTGASRGFEYWIRQGATLLTGPVTFYALLGAGLAIAFRLEDRKQARRLALAATVAAVGANTANELVSGWIAAQFEAGGVLDTLIISPGIPLLVEAPFVILVGLLLRSGLRTRAEQFRVAVATEAQTNRGAITRADAAVLRDPALRAWANVTVLRRMGFPTLRALRRLHRAQYELATWHWCQRTTTAPEDSTHLTLLRDRVLGRRTPPTLDRSQEARS